jgi:RecA-family ATPase
MLDGDPDLGKSTITLDLAARVSRGFAMPPEMGAASEPAGVLLMSAEDDLARTIRPRLDVAGAASSPTSPPSSATSTSSWAR